MTKKIYSLKEMIDKGFKISKNIIDFKAIAEQEIVEIPAFVAMEIQELKRSRRFEAGDEAPMICIFISDEDYADEARYFKLTRKWINSFKCSTDEVHQKRKIVLRAILENKYTIMNYKNLKVYYPIRINFETNDSYIIKNKLTNRLFVGKLELPDSDEYQSYFSLEELEDIFGRKQHSFYYLIDENNTFFEIID